MTKSTMLWFLERHVAEAQQAKLFHGFRCATCAAPGLSLPFSGCSRPALLQNPELSLNYKPSLDWAVHYSSSEAFLSLFSKSYFGKENLVSSCRRVCCLFLQKKSKSCPGLGLSELLTMCIPDVFLFFSLIYSARTHTCLNLYLKVYCYLIWKMPDIVRSCCLLEPKYILGETVKWHHFPFLGWIFLLLFSFRSLHL